jgi:hypothetical protein
MKKQVEENNIFNVNNNNNNNNNIIQIKNLSSSDFAVTSNDNELEILRETVNRLSIVSLVNISFVTQ